MKKSLLIGIFLVLFLIPALIPATVSAQGFVQCGNPGQKCCTICDFFDTLARIYNFLVINIATPLAVLSITIGAAVMIVSAGNPNIHGLGKKILYAAIIGLVLVYLSWIIINTILSSLGFQLGSWWNPHLSCPTTCTVPR